MKLVGHSKSVVNAQIAASYLPNQNSVQQKMVRCAWQTLFSTYDMRYFHHAIIHDICEVISRHPIAFEEDFIVQFIALEGHFPTNQVNYLYFLVRFYFQKNVRMC
jgi:hypothetical protein